MLLNSFSRRLLSLPALYSESTQNHRSVVNSLGKPRKFLTLDDVDIVRNPGEEYLDEFMKAYGSQRLNFKRNDIQMWKNAFGCDYNLQFLCLKDTKQIIQTTHYFNYKPIHPELDPPHQYHGFLWVDEDFRGKDTMLLVDYCMRSEMSGFSENCAAQCFPTSLNMFRKVHGDVQHTYATYVSYYDPSELRVPENLNVDGIIVKNASKVADKDIEAYDQDIFPYEKRSGYMIANLRDPDGIGKIAYDSNGTVIGLGALIIYPSGECMLNPLYANNTKVAQALFKSMLLEMPLNDDKLLRFHIKSLDRGNENWIWIRPFLKVPLRRELMAYGMFTRRPARVDYRKVFCGLSVTTSSV